jgi:phage/plasmid-associated DNA primase
MTHAYYRRHIVICFPRKFEGNDADPNLSKKMAKEEELSGIFNVLMTALRRVLHNKQIFVNEKTIQERREKYEMAANPIGSFIKEIVAEGSTESDQTTKDHYYKTLANYCKQHKLVVPSKESVGKILKKIYAYQEGREASGERRTVWKGVKLIEPYREKNNTIMQQPPKQFSN